MENISEKLEREEIKLAHISKRFLAYIIDEFIIAMLFIAIYFKQFSQAQNDVVAMTNLINFLFFQLIALKVIYQTFFVWLYGASIGKILMKIICLDTIMLSKPSIQKAFLRAIIRVISEACFYLGFVWAFGNTERQTWHDKLSGIIVCENQ